MFSELVLENSSNTKWYSLCCSTPSHNSNHYGSVFVCIHRTLFFPASLLRRPSCSSASPPLLLGYAAPLPLLQSCSAPLPKALLQSCSTLLP